MDMMNEEKQRIADALRGAGYDRSRKLGASTEEILANLPRKIHRTRQSRFVAGIAIAASLTILIGFSAPQIGAFAGALYQRMFGDVVQEKEAYHALPEEEKLVRMIDEYAQYGGEHRVSGASGRVGEVNVSVNWVSIHPREYARGAHEHSVEGMLRAAIVYDKLPPFDPNYVDFSIVMEGVEYPQYVDENGLGEYRAERTELTSIADWEDAWSLSHSYIGKDGAPTTGLFFEVPDWQWTQPRELTLKADIDGQALAIPFTYDPEKAHVDAVESAKQSLLYIAGDYEAEKPVLDALLENAVPIGISGASDGAEYMLTEMAAIEQEIRFMAMLDVAPGMDDREFGPSIGLSTVLIDGFATGAVNYTLDALGDVGQYAAIYRVPVARDLRNLPEESLMMLAFGDSTDADRSKDCRMAYRYNWKEKTVTLAKDGEEMQQWVAESLAMQAEIYRGFEVGEEEYKVIRCDLVDLDLVQRAGDMALAVRSAEYVLPGVHRIALKVELTGDMEASEYAWYLSPKVTVNGVIAPDAGGSTDMEDRPLSFEVYPALGITEFGEDTRIVLEYPLVKKGTDMDLPHELEGTLHYEFAIDKDSRALTVVDLMKE